MAVFAVTYTYSPDADRLAEFRPEHRAFLGGLNEAGSVIVSGPLPADDGGTGGALIIVDAPDADAVTALLDADPLHREDLVAERVVREWIPVIGSLGR